MNIDQALTDPGFFVDNDPHPIWRQLRCEDPIHWTQGRVSPFWSITRYDDIIAVFSEPNLFTSTRGLIIASSPEMEQLTPEMQGADQMMIHDRSAFAYRYASGIQPAFPTSAGWQV